MASRIHDNILHMLTQYLSLISDTGLRLSDGLVQLILLARGLCCEPKVFVLDNGTANRSRHGIEHRRTGCRASHRPPSFSPTGPRSWRRDVTRSLFVVCIGRC